VQHAVVCSHDFRFEDLYAVCRRDLRELAQQNAAEPAALKLVCDRERDFRALVVDRNVERMTDDTLVFAAARDQSESLVQVRFSMRFRRERCAVLVTVKPQPA